MNNTQSRALTLARLFAESYPDVKCGLEAGQSPFKLLIMSILSAQCTDKRVNAVSVELFCRFPTAEAFADADIPEIEAYIKSCGLYHAKAKNIKACCKLLVEKHDSVVPSSMDELLELPGVGRKIANLIRGDIYGLGGIVADTHMIRIANRLGFADSDNAYAVEKSLSALIPIDEQSEFCHRAVHFGREICCARSPKCSQCFVRDSGLCGGINQ